MKIVPIGLGCFLLFALAFNGGLGDSFSNYSAVISGITLILAGASLQTKNFARVSFYLGIVSGLTYLPVIVSRINSEFGIDFIGLIFDGLYIYLIISIINGGKPHKSVSETGSNNTIPK